MKQYLDLVRTILDTGAWQENRTGIRTISMPGAMMRFDLQEGFPAVTTKKLAFKSAIGEMIGFLRASRSAADFRALGCKVWDANANENAQWLANPYRDVAHLAGLYGDGWGGGGALGRCRGAWVPHRHAVRGRRRAEGAAL